MKMIAPNIARPIRKPSDEATRNTLERNSFSGMIGSAARRSTSTKAIRSTTETSASPRIVPEPQRYSLPPQVVTRTSALTPAVSSAGAEPVDLVAVRRRVQMQSGDHDHDRDQPERDVHVEHPAPRDRLDQEAAEQRAGDRRDREHGADQAHVAAAIARRHDVGDDRLRAHHQPARADALQRAEARSAAPSSGSARTAASRPGRSGSRPGTSACGRTCRRACRTAASTPSRPAGRT